jgi:DNA-directed RNA polymerase I subunit RPA2
MKILAAKIQKPLREWQTQTPLSPKECRDRGITYGGKLLCIVNYRLDGKQTQTLTINFGNIPIMVRSKACWLCKIKGKQIISIGEEERENGGYFICNGIERLVRLFITPRKNYVLALRRHAYTKRGAMYSDAATCSFRTA